MSNPLFPAFKKGMTVGEKYLPAMSITDPEVGAEYLALCVQHTMEHGGYSYAEALDMEMQNLGYIAGNCGVDVMRQVEQVFGAAHPLLGSTTPGSLFVMPPLFAESPKRD